MKAKLPPLTGGKLKWGKSIYIRQPPVGDFMKSVILFAAGSIFLPITVYKLAKIGQRNLPKDNEL